MAIMPASIPFCGHSRAVRYCRIELEVADVPIKQYHVRAAVRRQDAIDKISKGPSIQKYLSNGALTFAIVPDNTKPGAYYESAKGCSYIIHVASPLATVPGDLVSQAVAGNKAILEAAEATPSIKRVVITASTAAIRSFERLLKNDPANQAIMAGRADEVPTLTAEAKLPTEPPVSDDAPPFRRYNNSKIAAINLVHEYAASQKPRFSIINIMPGWVLGPEELSQSKKEAFQGSNQILGWLFAPISIGPFFGLPAEEETPLLSETIHLDDVADGHVKALDTEKVPGQYRNFLLCSDGPSGPVIMDAAEIVRKELPQEVADGKITFAGELGKLRSILTVHLKSSVGKANVHSLQARRSTSSTQRRRSAICSDILSGLLVSR